MLKNMRGYIAIFINIKEKFVQRLAFSILTNKLIY